MARPESITEPGFQMSFAAVAALIAVAEAYPGGGHWRSLPRTALVASLATVPVTLFHFGRATHYAVLGNLLAMPIMGFVVMPLAALSVAAMPFGLEAGPLHLLGFGIAAMLWVGRLVSGLPGAVSVTPAMPLMALLLAITGGLWLAIWRRPWRWLGLAPLAASIAVALMARGPDLLVAPDAMTVALRGDDGLLHFVSRPRDRFAARDWLSRDGDMRTPAQASGFPDARCDGYGCVVRTRDGSLVAMSRRVESLGEDCLRAAIVVSAHAGNCKGPREIIDPMRASMDEGDAIWFGPHTHTQSVAHARGARPWTRLVPLNSGG